MINPSMCTSFFGLSPCIHASMHPEESPPKGHMQRWGAFSSCDTHVPNYDGQIYTMLSSQWPDQCGAMVCTLYFAVVATPTYLIVMDGCIQCWAAIDLTVCSAGLAQAIAPTIFMWLTVVTLIFQLPLLYCEFTYMCVHQAHWLSPPLVG